MVLTENPAHITKLNCDQVEEVKMSNETPEPVLGLRHGCVLSQPLFNVYSKTMFREASKTLVDLNYTAKKYQIYRRHSQSSW